MGKAKVPFVKMEATGNDFVVFNFLNEEHFNFTCENVKQICDRKCGVGADGVLVIMPSEKAHFRMRIFNADGSEGEMCGNGIVCFGYLVKSLGLIDGAKEITVETKAGIMVIKIDDNHDRLEVKVDMGYPVFEKSQIPMIGEGSLAIPEKIHLNGEIIEVNSLLMGVPHTVVFYDDLNELGHDDFVYYGKSIETNDYYPKKTNVMFVQVMDEHTLRMLPWERGAGETDGCGTGSCASAIVSMIRGKCSSPVTVRNPGGLIKVEWQRGGTVNMSAVPKIIFTGMWAIE